MEGGDHTGLRLQVTKLGARAPEPPCAGGLYRRDPGDHFTSMDTLIGTSVYRPSRTYFSEHFPRPVDTEVVRLLKLLDTIPLVTIPALAVEGGEAV